LNPLQWDKVTLNLPGNQAYDPTLPSVMKWNKGINNIAGNIMAFLDDM
jgi:hypothetical protein